MSKKELSARQRKRRTHRCVRVRGEAKIVFCGRTPSTLELGAETPRILMSCDGTPIES